MSYSDPRSPGAGLLFFGVILPLAALVVELATSLCASTFFDPIPTWGHALAVLAVPAANYALWAAARREAPASPWLTSVAGAAMVIAAAYALVFLPLLPIAVIGILLLGLGLLAWAPVLSLIACFKLAGRLIGEPGHGARQLLGGVAAGLALVILVDLPAAATYLAVGWAGGDPASARRATALMRAAGDEAMLLRLCYGGNGRATGLASFAVSTWSDGMLTGEPVSTSAAARELYYRTTGRPFNAAEPPLRGRRQDMLWGFDEDRGGAAVGGRARGLELASSRLDGSVAAKDNLAYLEWTAEFANRSQTAQEARLTLALPPGSVASRATLWIDGVAREASVAGKREARAAYENVVAVRRDPLLVTTDSAGRLLVQAFPVPAKGDLKLRIGMTIPFEIAPDGRRSFALPAIADRNFDLPSTLRHRVWVEGDSPVTSSHPGFSGSGTARLRAALGDFDLGAHRPRIAAGPVRAPSVRDAAVPATATEPALHIVQTIARARLPRPSRLILLVDSSASSRKAAAGLARALGALPAGLPVGLFIAGEEPVIVAPAPSSPAQLSRMKQALAAAAFTGGQDNLPALADALDASGGPESVLVWIHGAQPVAFASSAARLDQLLDRSEALPRLVRYQAEPGPAFAAAGHAWFQSAYDSPPSGDPATDLGALLSRLVGGEGWSVTRSQAQGKAGPASSIHIARLWGAERLIAGAQAEGKERERAIALANRLNIVTPVSGAVVLETDGEYKRNGLAVPDPADVPTVPEPETWALIAIAAALLLWHWHRRRRPAFA
ncbi:MAG TPA: VIT domain-containing protein [Allosphingosinicella sp.]|jgi:hypothetical protein